MAKRKASQPLSLRRDDLSAWNFIIFLTLAFILLVLVLSAMNKISFDLRSRAGQVCPQVTLPRPEDCRGNWIYQRNANGCPAFFCRVQIPTPVPVRRITPSVRK